MRIVAGSFKGTVIKAVAGNKTRPTADKVKEAVFHRLGPFFDGGEALDLFAGTGSLGLEALSRGFDSAVFVDQSSQALKTIKLNINQCRCEDQAEVYKNDAERGIEALARRGRSFDAVFLDPPYAAGKIPNLLEKLDKHQLVKEEGFVLCEHASKETLPAQAGSLEKHREDKYGDTMITIYYKS
ncbi:16S rRNA (guanine(966)-N(2))-methyltransferase RsmD [Sinobaca qinghaiensis]|uniref:16S rRNA (Guanine(966)-N(2))-methyltransferase RsmD n=1 Tax=Sinobaca qinghaiensis TaxID=342944 RepID=A0A419V6F6_9BACL|nr:16S rRNA (guanine(966)-N(2))-methyltransferase RsmD [Sinobaca qinghaiensis]RKD75467.1 16S rRNA (guanine(966)-N(2))-methyltransferase RsmD [Sinobaca qinghaiensis]